MAALAPGPPVIEPGGDAPHSDASAPATASEIAPAIPQLQGCVGRHVAYQIQEGDTIFGLCIKFRVREEDVFRCNQTLSPVIVPGFWIGIPVRDDKTEALVASMSASGTGLRSGPWGVDRLAAGRHAPMRLQRRSERLFAARGWCAWCSPRSPCPKARRARRSSRWGATRCAPQAIGSDD